ncbi:MAG: gliding motility-associated C-terminal domain-containing protein, partial [Flavobacteriales bacterium]|nr:gliding motility-associated C-terminal domain-containing protein [Flavobacteriales bacterium]
TTVCQKDAPFLLTASPPGGVWIGNGISTQNPGMFYPDSAGPGLHAIAYLLGGSCSDVLNITVDSIDAGPLEAACPGTPPFQVSGYGPGGGTWSGPNITPGGIFDPVAIGTYTVTYTQGNCSASKDINVDNIGYTSPFDTICQSHDTFRLQITPAGGYWVGTNIEDSATGLFNPREDAGSIVSTYIMNGCQLSDTIEVLPIDIGHNTNACPTEAPYQLYPSFTPTGGVWYGNGIIDNVQGIFDPALIGQGNNDTIVYAAPNGCFDTIINYVRFTDLDDDTLTFCIASEDDDTLRLNDDLTGMIPWGGDWYGTGVTQFSPNGWYYFISQNAGPGLHTLTYDANGCLDSMVFIVYPDQINYPDTSMCSSADSIFFPSLPLGAYWSGDGIVDPSGIYDPNAAVDDTSLVIYNSGLPECTDSILIEVIPFQKAIIQNIDTQYCFQDIPYPIGLSPTGGVFAGASNDSIFNPSVEGAGQHVLTYMVGSGACQSFDTLVVNILPELTTNTSPKSDSICEGEGALLEVNGAGGSTPGVYSYSWDNGLFPVNSHNVSPVVDQWYVCITNDGCSDPVIDSFFVLVHPPFDVDVQTSNKKCFGEEGYAVAVPNPSGSYNYDWSISALTTDSIPGMAGDIITLKTVDAQTGCERDTLFKIPNYNAVKALFIINPNEDCIPYDQRNVSFLDLSENVVTGKWIIDGEESDYVLGENPTKNFENPGQYDVELYVENEGGCKDSAFSTVCIDDNSSYFIPDIFSPNGDGHNDIFYVRVRNYKQGRIQVFDRWGGLVFETTNFDVGWDGKVRGERVPSGSYLYVLDITFSNNSSEVIKGDVSLVR